MQDHRAKLVAVDPYGRQHKPADGNFENLISNWSRLKTRLTIFLGAGASVGARNRRGDHLPTAYELRNDLWAQIMLDDKSRANFDPLNLKSMSLEHAAAIAESRAGRGAILEQVIGTFDCTKPLWHHAVLCHLQPKAVFTVNFDELIEKGWAENAGKGGIEDLVLQFDAKQKPAPKHVPLFKPHGTLRYSANKIGEGGLVLTMFDYFEMISDYKGMIEKFLSDFDQSCVIFIGYSFGDLDICAELFRLRRSRNIPWYAVFPRDDLDVRQMYFDKFGIRQINRTFFDFMVELDERVNFIPAEWKTDRLASLCSTGVIQ